MKKEEYKIEVSGGSLYDNQFTIETSLTAREYLKLVGIILDFTENIPKEKEKKTKTPKE